MSFDLDCGVRLSLLLNLNVVKMSSSNIKFYFIIFNLLVLCCDLYIVNFCFEKKKKNQLFGVQSGYRILGDY